MVILLILSLTSHRRHLCFFFEWIREAGARPRTDIGFLSLYNGKSDIILSLLLVLKKYNLVSAFYRSNMIKTRKIRGDYFLSSSRKLNPKPQLERSDAVLAQANNNKPKTTRCGRRRTSRARVSRCFRAQLTSLRYVRCTLPRATLVHGWIVVFHSV